MTTITWTRIVIVDFAAGLPDLPTAEARLLRNEADIGKAIKTYYGSAAGNQLTSLLRTSRPTGSSASSRCASNR